MIDFNSMFLLLVLGILIGFLIGWLVARMKFTSKLSNASFNPQDYVSKDVFQNIDNQLVESRKSLAEKQEDLITLEKILATRERDIIYLEEKLNHWNKDFEALKSRSKEEFENLAHQILERKSQKIAHQQEQKLNDLLQPLRENIKDFGLDIERRFTDEAKDKVSLKKEIEQLKDLNLQLSTDAQLLAAALKGDAKVQGDWGEYHLEIILEKAGLSKGVHFIVQPSFKDHNGHDKRPDFIINLPDDKHLIIDSKVSLKAY